MNNKTIILGVVNVDWHFAKGKFSCKCSNTEYMNSFDRAICGILYRSHGYMPKYDLATILGFNVIENQAENRYIDCSEKVIFDNAVSSLSKYGLIVDDGYTLKLTDSGEESYNTRTKQRIEDKEIELWASEFTGFELNSDSIKGFSILPIEVSDCPEWNKLYTSPEEALKFQKADLVNSDCGKSVSSISLIRMEYYVASLKCNVCYELDKKRFYVCPTFCDESIDKIILGNEKLHSHLIDEFFKNQKRSVIYKLPHQKQMEDFILEQDFDENNLNLIPITSKEDFFFRINNNIIGDNVIIAFFSLPLLTGEIKVILKKLRCDVICVDYAKDDAVGQEDTKQLVVEGNICYNHTDELRTNDLCVCGETYYSILPYVVNYKGLDYNIPMIYRYERGKYNYEQLYSPFIEHIFKIVSGNLLTLTRDLTSNDIKRVLKSQSFFDKLGQDYKEFDISDKIHQLDNLVQQLLVVWNNKLQDRLNEIEAELITGGDKSLLLSSLNIIESEIKKSSGDVGLLSYVDEIRQRFTEQDVISLPKIQSQKLYILDTSIFMDMYNILDKFDLAHDRIIVPRAMEQELDGLTHDVDKKDTALKARFALRRKKDDYPHFISIKDNVNRSLLPSGFDPEKADNDMLATAIELQSSENVDVVTIVSNDTQFISNVNDCINEGIISDKIEGIDLNELLIRLSD